MKNALGFAAFLLLAAILGLLLGVAGGATFRLIAGPPAPPPTCEPGHFYSARENACLTGYRIQTR